MKIFKVTNWSTIIRRNKRFYKGLVLSIPFFFIGAYLIVKGHDSFLSLLIGTMLYWTIQGLTTKERNYI